VAEYLLTFGSAHKALKAESVLKENAVPFRLLPAPKALVEHCDLVISIAGEDALKAALGALNTSPAKVKLKFRKDGESYVKV
jgi:hypothetical protein